MNPKIAYLEGQVKSASPIGLIIMLYDGLITFSGDAIDCLRRGDNDSICHAAEAISRATRILTELNSSLRHDVSPEFSYRLSNLYSFFLDRLAKARVENNPQFIEEIIPLVEGLRNSWKDAEIQANQDSSAPAAA